MTLTSRDASLRELQQTLAAVILEPERIGTQVPAWLAPPARGSITDRLRVYANGYPARVQEAIEETFPAVTHLIGHRETHALCARYVGALTLHSYNLNDVGAELPRFLRRDALSVRFPFLPDLAELEWNVTQAFHAFDAAPFDPSALHNLTLAAWERAVLQFQPSVSVLTSAWPIRDLWAARETALEQIAIDLRDRPDHVLIYRSGLRVCCESIAAGEARALDRLLAGQSLGEVAEWLQMAGFAAADVSNWFAGWMQRGIIRASNGERPG